MQSLPKSLKSLFKFRESYDKKIFQFLGYLACLSLHAAAWGDMADNGLECSVVMEKARFDERETFPDFKLVFINKGEKTVRLFDDFYPIKGYGPNISISICPKTRNGDKLEIPVAGYNPGYKIQRGVAPLKFIVLNPGEKYEVLIKDAYSLLRYLKPFYRLHNGEMYELEVGFHDGYGDPGTPRDYVGRVDFEPVSKSPKGC